MDELIDLRKTKNDLLDFLRKMIEKVQGVEELASFKLKEITSSQIKNEDDDIRQFAEKLPTSGSHIYYFKVNDSSELMEKFNAKSKASEYKYARNNKNADSNYIYVGSCTKTKLSNRFMQHCGWKDPKTYSLQLSKWVGDDELTFTFAYAEIKDSLIAQQLEDQLHRDLKPLFGKPGGNNKITASK